jgi:hypothetical protein
LAHAFVGLACDLALVLDAQGHASPAWPMGPGQRLACLDGLGRLGRAAWADTVTPDTQAKVHALLAEVAAKGAAASPRTHVLPGAAACRWHLRRLRLGAAGGPTLVLGHDLRAAAAPAAAFHRRAA